MMNRSLSSSIALLLVFLLLFTSCKFGPSYPEKSVEEPPVGEREQQEEEDEPEEEPDDTVDGKVFQLNTVEEENKTAKDLGLRTVIESNIANRSSIAEKLEKRGLSHPADLPEAYPFLLYAWTVDKAKGEDGIANGTQKLSPEQVSKLLTATYTSSSLIKGIPFALQETKYYDSASDSYLIEETTVEQDLSLGSFSLLYEEKGDELTVFVTPSDSSLQAADLEYYTYVFEKAEDDYRLVSAQAERVPEKVENLGSGIEITQQLSTEDYKNYTVVGSLGNRPIAVEYWDQIFTVTLLDNSFQPTKEITFEAGEPELVFRNDQLLLKFPTEYVVLDSSLTPVSSSKLPEFMIAYQNQFPNPQYDKNTGRNLEFYDYDVTNDNQYILYASGYGLFLYNTNTGLQITLMDSGVAQGGGSSYLHTPFQVWFTPDNSYAYGYINGGGTSSYVRYDLKNQKAENPTLSEISSSALATSHNNSGSFFAPAISQLFTVGKDYYVTESSGSITLGLVASPSTTVNVSKPTKDCQVSALLEDGRVVYMDDSSEKTKTYYTVAPTITPPAVSQEKTEESQEEPIGAPQPGDLS